MPKPRRFEAWSASRYNDYDQCPAKAAYKHLDKLPEPSSPAMERGTRIHKLAEDFVKGLLPKLPAELKLFEAQFKELKTLFKKKAWPMIVEDQWAFTKTWEDTEWNDWANCVVRVKVDLAYYADGATMFVIDHKTGKMNDYKNAEYMRALELYALAALLKSAVKEVVVIPKLWYLDSGNTFPSEEIKYTRADLPKLKKAWEARVRPMLNDQKFVPKPGKACTWCHYRKANNGPCKF